VLLLFDRGRILETSRSVKSKAFGVRQTSSSEWRGADHALKWTGSTCMEANLQLSVLPSNITREIILHRTFSRYLFPFFILTFKSKRKFLYLVALRNSFKQVSSSKAWCLHPLRISMTMSFQKSGVFSLDLVKSCSGYTRRPCVTCVGTAKCNKCSQFLTWGDDEWPDCCHAHGSCKDRYFGNGDFEASWGLRIVACWMCCVWNVTSGGISPIRCPGSLETLCSVSNLFTPICSFVGRTTLQFLPGTPHYCKFPLQAQIIWK